MPLKTTVITTIQLTLGCLLYMSIAEESGPCDYDLDLTKNTVKISCQGSPSVVNVYADKALLQADDNRGNYFGETGYEKTMTGRGPGSESQKMESTRSSGHPEKQTSSRSGPQGPGEPSAFQKDRHEMSSKYTGTFAEVISNASLKLDKMKQSLKNYNDTVQNVTFSLNSGDLLLRADMEKLRKTSNSASDLKDGIIAAMSNHFYYMRSVLLTRNHELETLVKSLTELVNLTAEVLPSGLLAYRMAMDEVNHVNTTLQAVRKMVSKELMKKEIVKDAKGNKNDQCPKEISAIGAGSYKTVEWATGSYMVQSVHPSEFRSVFIIEGTGPADQLREYHAPVDVEPDLVGRYYVLPFSCTGTGHVVYRRHFYCHKLDTNIVVKYHMKKSNVAEELVLPGALFGNMGAYSSGQNTDIDLAVDENGLWAIYATKDSAGKIVISKIDHKTMQIEHTWRTSQTKKEAGNAFIICGVLYAVNSHKDTPTFIRYIFNTNTNTERVLEKGEVPFSNSALLGLSDVPQKTSQEKSANTVMLSYDYRTSSLYSWNNGRIETFPVFFKTNK